MGPSTGTALPRVEWENFTPRGEIIRTADHSLGGIPDRCEVREQRYRDQRVQDLVPGLDVLLEKLERELLEPLRHLVRHCQVDGRMTFVIGACNGSQ